MWIVGSEGQYFFLSLCDTFFLCIFTFEMMDDNFNIWSTLSCCLRGVAKVRTHKTYVYVSGLLQHPLIYPTVYDMSHTFT